MKWLQELIDRYPLVFIVAVLLVLAAVFLPGCSQDFPDRIPTPLESVQRFDRLLLHRLDDIDRDLKSVKGHIVGDR